MKKLALLTVALLPLVACSQNENKATAEDFAVVDVIVKAATPDMIVATGAEELVVKVPATEELMAVYAKDKDTSFVTANIAQFVEEGNCYINVLAANDYRLFCGAATDITPDTMWAVQLTIPAEAPAEVPAEAPAEAK